MTDKEFEEFLDQSGLSHLKPFISNTAEVAQKLSRIPTGAAKNVPELLQALRQAQDKISEQDGEIKRLSGFPLAHAVVIFSDETSGDSPVSPHPLLIMHEGRVIEVLPPPNKKIKAGDIVKISPKTTQIIDVASGPHPGGVATIHRVLDTFLSEANYQGVTRIVVNGKFANQLEAGDRVKVDSSASVILERLSRDEDRYRFSEETNISWDDIGGLEEAKEQLIEAIELPYKEPELFAFYNKKPIKGIILYGPPGCGKTMLGKAAFTSLARTHDNKGIATGFLSIKGPEILDRYVGAAEATIRQIFWQAKMHEKKYGYPAIIFIDEADAILYERGSGRSSDIERTIVPAFLAEMDGLSKSGAIVILATNRPDVLDRAVIRNGRMDRKIKVTRPTRASAATIFELNFKKIPFAENTSKREMAEFAVKELFSEKYALYEITLDGSRAGEIIKFTLSNMVNGAMIAGIADQSSSVAFHRDRKEKTKQGIVKDDVIKATESIFRESLDLDQNKELDEYIHDYLENVEIGGIKKLKQTMK
ncbi:MAG: hypothetical protein A3G49_05310 [Candidatus Sungbacteria bacterium RIFCSPLOWO2_12_FULL_41_11]|uniref:AAA+ ATPase domain-containing protein n=1 Tax=Candidatus Sungbacteria bacterium RIFCSPLOWO2_12_FULL_41_11 TaxID=1802286 RepID=A0A1G2LUN0_9BACT|nr:MAG: Proteasome-associated ATPase [Parcubacteria group bacterium GW2011_GWA2_42_14]OGY15744.1 MAG: hypothetical protein A3I52_01655 [Candidatus Blackburnbacteria bacterium RIFCSPLOWO2_02_FULL_40_10]OHA14582.1 MAG: hypothetical protein A3G49_05310 [Candidatus Sungbacteria bacterium RIFCSPLOWO2_12_FULL_41_11]